MADMDIDMLDLEVDPTEDYERQQREPIVNQILSDQPQKPYLFNSLPESDSPSIQLTPHKVHVRGLDNLKTSDLETFAADHFGGLQFERIEWIDDTSANLVYANSEVALQALTSFAATEVVLDQLQTLQLLPAKSLSSHPDARLEVRLAVTTDRKQAGARERSRFYLFNPEYDHAERRSKQGAAGRSRRYRDRDDGSYRSRVFDEDERQRRENNDVFDASLYDDDAESLAQRSKSLSGGQPRSRTTFHGSRSQDVQAPQVSKELFPGRLQRSNEGRLRNRSASPSRYEDDDVWIRNPGSFPTTRHIAINNGGSENRLKASMIKSSLRHAAAQTKDLFPQKIGNVHKESAALDPRDETADLFSYKMSIPVVDGSGEIPLLQQVDSRRRGRLEDRISLPNKGVGEFNIKGSAKDVPSSDFSIKGAASSKTLENTPSNTRLNSNSGKELFTEKLEGRGGKRRRAEDMFR